MKDEEQNSVTGNAVEYDGTVDEYDQEEEGYEDDESVQEGEDFDDDDYDEYYEGDEGDEYDDEVETAIYTEIVRRTTAIDMMQGMIENVSNTYWGLLKDSEMNLMYSIMGKARDRVEGYCRSDEFVCQEIMPDLIDEGYSYNQDEEV